MSSCVIAPAAEPITAIDGRPASPAMARALAQLDAMFGESVRRTARINADSRIIWLRAQSAALWSEIPEGMDGAAHLFREVSEGRLARRHRVASLIRARIAQLDDYRSVVRRELADAAACRAAIEVSDDLTVMLELWRQGSPQCRDAALEIADRNRIRSRPDDNR